MFVYIKTSHLQVPIKHMTCTVLTFIECIYSSVRFVVYVATPLTRFILSPTFRYSHSLFLSLRNEYSFSWE